LERLVILVTVLRYCASCKIVMTPKLEFLRPYSDAYTLSAICRSSLCCLQCSKYHSVSVCACVCVVDCAANVAEYTYFDGARFTTKTGQSLRTKKVKYACYVTIKECHTFFSAATVCDNLGGSLASFEMSPVMKNAEFHGGGDSCTRSSKYTHCQWTGLVRKVWTWPSLGLSL